MISTHDSFYNQNTSIWGPSMTSKSSCRSPHHRIYNPRGNSTKINYFSCSYKVWTQSLKSQGKLLVGWLKNTAFVCSHKGLGNVASTWQVYSCLRWSRKTNLSTSGENRVHIFLRQMHPKVRGGEKCSFQWYQSEKSLSAGEDTG